MIPFLGRDADQLAESCAGEPSTGTTEKFEGDDGTTCRYRICAIV